MNAFRSTFSWLLPVAGCAALLAGCGSNAAPRAPEQYALTLQRSAVVQRAPFAPNALQSVPNVAGTYAGTFAETVRSKTSNGTVVITIVQSGTAISGTVAATLNGKTADLNLSGTVKQGKTGAKLIFTIFVPHGRNFAAHGTVKGRNLKGKAYAPPSGNLPAISIAYSTVKQ